LFLRRCLIPCSELDFQRDLILCSELDFQRGLILCRALIFRRGLFFFFRNIHFFTRGRTGVRIAVDPASSTIQYNFTIYFFLKKCYLYCK